jgi:hypothetical protein
MMRHARMEISRMKYRIGWLLAVTASIATANAQTALGQSSSSTSSAASLTANPGKDPLKSATKPLTPKSAMPAQRKPAPVMPPATGAHTSSDLNRLERTNIGASTSKGAAPAIGKSSDPTPSQAMNFKYQKPVGGTQASAPNARAANSTKPRVSQK